jgi:phosphatidylserine decarboxylase
MLRLTSHGQREILIGTIILGVLAAVLYWVWPPLALLVVAVWAWLLAFFRDPERQLPAEQHAMVSPADGRVSDIAEIEHMDLLGGPALRVGIFLSVFNVHINRAPCDGRVVKVIYRKGRFINAMSHARASEENESNTLLINDLVEDRPVAVVRQIVGLIARRIICSTPEGTAVARGQRIGMIKFGSRTELYIPRWLEPEIQVSVGQAVRGAADVIALVRKPIPTTSPAPDEKCT